MRSGGIVFVSAVLAVASPCVALAQPPPELPRNVNVADCADAMRKVHAAEPQQLLGETTYFPQVVPVEGKPNTFRFTVVPNATFIYDFIWPNMSAAEQAAVRRHLPALRAHEA